MVYYFTNARKVKRTDHCGPLKTPIVAVTAEGAYVTVLRPCTYPDPRRPGKVYYSSWYDTWRFVNGKADEHWDPAMLAPQPRKK